MSELLKNNINTYADTTTYNADLTKDFPNISYIEGTDEVKWVKEDPTLITATYNVTNNGQNKLLHNNTNIEKMWVDGVLQPNVITTFIFQTIGEHIVKYKLTDNVSISSYTFYFLGGLKSIIIPNNVTSIGKSAFIDNNSMQSITVEATTPPTLYDKNVFYNTNNCPIYVPAESVDTYKAASGWSGLASRIVAIPTT